jgi:hypothetical protein
MTVHPRSTKHYRKFGPVTVTEGKNVKIIRNEEYLRIRKDTGAIVTDKEGMSVVAPKEKVEKHA